MKFEMDKHQSRASIFLSGFGDSEEPHLGCLFQIRLLLTEWTTLLLL
jgi:hypothetical protein